MLSSGIRSNSKQHPACNAMLNASAQTVYFLPLTPNKTYCVETISLFGPKATQIHSNRKHNRHPTWWRSKKGKEVFFQTQATAAMQFGTEYSRLLVDP
jgi:hypothetical protein